ncbi:hypothetical protein KY363_00860 [Candidatus Woesearchaeota archaeon]|nr:hypothetical protein [Candidatus Woesearchaeota archaeon]
MRFEGTYDQDTMSCSSKSDDPGSNRISEPTSLESVIRRHAAHMPAESGYTGGEVTERLIELAGGRVSDVTLDMGNEILRHHKENIDLEFVAYAMDLVETRFSLADQEQERLRASKLLASWIASTPVEMVDKADITRKLDIIEPLVASDAVYDLCHDLVSSQLRSPSPYFAEDLIVIERSRGIYDHLPVEMQRLVKDMVYKAVRRNAQVQSFADRRRYDYLHSIIHSMRFFTRRGKDKRKDFLSHPAMYDLSRRLMVKDRKDISYPFYDLLGRVPAGAPTELIDVVESVVDSLPGDCACDDAEFSRAYRFMSYLLKFDPKYSGKMFQLAGTVWEYLSRRREPEEEEDDVLAGEEKKAFGFIDCLMKFGEGYSDEVYDVLSKVWSHVSKEGCCAVVPRSDMCDDLGSRSVNPDDDFDLEEGGSADSFCEGLSDQSRMTSPESLFTNRLMKLRTAGPAVVGLAGKVWGHMVSEDDPYPHRVQLGCRFLDYLSTVPSGVPDAAVGVVESFWDVLRYYPDVDSSVVQRGYAFLTRMLGSAAEKNPDSFGIVSVLLDYFVMADELDYDKMGSAYELINKVQSFDRAAPADIMGLVGKVAGFVAMETDFDQYYCRTADFFLSTLANCPVDVSEKTVKIADYVWEYISTADIELDDDVKRKVRSFMSQLWKLPSNGKDMTVLAGLMWDLVAAGISREEYSISHTALELFSSMPARMDDKVRELSECVLNYTFNSVDDLREDGLRKVKSYLQYLWRFPENVPGIVMNATENAWDLMMSASSASEKGIYDCGFIRTLSRAFEMHEPYEVATFFHLYQGLSLSSESQFAARHARNLQSLLGKSIRERQRALQQFSDSEDEDSAFKHLDEVLEKRKQRKLEHRISEIGLEYLLLSGMLDYAATNTHLDNPKRHFADAVVNLNSLPFDTSWVLENMWLYDRGIVLRSEELSDVDEEERLNNTVEILSVRQSHLRQVERELYEIHDRGPKDCPEPLRSYLEKKFKRKVAKVWDLRLFQDRLYLSSPSVQAFSPLSDEVDVAAMRTAVDIMSRMQMLEPKLHYLAGACGFGFNEIEFCLALEGKGYKVRMDMNDTSMRMRGRAMTNALRRGITAAEPFSKDIKKLTFEDLKGIDRQVLLSLHGKVWWNWPDRLEWLDRVWGIYAQRDATNPAGEYMMRRHDESYSRRRDALIIQGRKKQNYHYYASELSKLFLARGLEGGFNLTMDALMRNNRLQHTLFYDKGNMELQCVYLVTKDCGRFKEDHAILVIDTGTLHEKIIARQLEEHGFRSTFVDGKKDTTIAICEWYDK